MAAPVSAAIARLQCGSRSLDLTRPQIMGVLNITPDSFSDGGSLYRDNAVALDAALQRCAAMLAAGASIIDIGGESTRPGAAAVGEQQELDRVLPVVAAIAARFDCVISVDTSSPRLMREAAAAGAGLINDVRALEREGAVDALLATGLPVCLMHRQGEPATMQHSPSYRDVVAEVSAYLLSRAFELQAAGVARQRIVLDPGFGFGKNDSHNLALLRELPRLAESGYPLLVGLSRKSMIGRLLSREVDQRLAGSIALALLAVQKGAAIVRVHDVAETADAINLWLALERPAAQAAE